LAVALVGFPLVPVVLAVVVVAVLAVLYPPTAAPAGA
jgi:hypothetical protein